MLFVVAVATEAWTCSPSATASTYPLVAACVACVGVPLIVTFPAIVMLSGRPIVTAPVEADTSISLAVPVRLDTPPEALKDRLPASSL